MILQHIYIAILNVVFKLTGKISERVRETLLFACFLIFACIYAFKAKTGDVQGRMAFCTVMVLFMTVLSVKKELKPIKWNYGIYIPFILFGIGILAISRLHFVGEGYTLFAVCLIFLLPAFYLVWINRGDYDRLYIKMAVAFGIAGTALFIYSFYAATNGDYQIYGDGRALGTTGNPNYLGMAGLTMVLAGEYLFLEFKKIPGAVFSGVIIGEGLSMIVESVSRAALLSAVFATIVLIIFVIKRNRSGDSEVKMTLKMASAALIVLILLAYIGLEVDDLQKDVRRQQIYAERNQTETADATSNDFSLNSLIEKELNFTAYADDFTDIGGRIIPDGDVDDFSSGRLGIWKVYLDKITVFGSDYNELEEQKDDFPNGKVIRAHNNFLEYLFRCGIPVSAFYILIYLYMGLRVVGIIISKKRFYSGAFYSAVVFVAYALYSMVEISDLPFVRCVPFLFFMSLAPYFEKESRYL